MTRIVRATDSFLTSAIDGRKLQPSDRRLVGPQSPSACSAEGRTGTVASNILRSASRSPARPVGQDAHCTIPTPSALKLVRLNRDRERGREGGGVQKSLLLYRLPGSAHLSIGTGRLVAR